ncbi:hypothetical protein MNB_SV-4-163 [hydrothermal vent metagenome]|uniref:Uncharacterized protein n=1 Tax=hydrothermal vent metagenome TaxID=652676 RepID=A0A1W1EB48_9ZZZZ
MDLIALIEQTNVFYEIYKKAQKLGSDEEAIGKYCVKLLLEDAQIDKEQFFYGIMVSGDDESGLWRIGFSYEEAVALAATWRPRYRTSWQAFQLKPEKSVAIEKRSLMEILNDSEWSAHFVKRMRSLVPHSKKEIEYLKAHGKMKMLWSSEFHEGEEQFIYSDGKSFLFPVHPNNKAVFGLDFQWSAVVDGEGNYGVIANKTTHTSKDAAFELVLEPKYYLVDVKISYAQVQKQKPDVGDDAKANICDIVNLQTKEAIDSHVLWDSLFESLSYVKYITVDEEGLLQYNYIDEQTGIHKQSKKYLTIIDRIDTIAVQDKETLLWGYIDKEGNELISPRFRDWGSFNDGYAVIREKGNKPFAIDIKGNVIIKPEYDDVRHSYENDLFFVQKEGQWAVFKGGEIYIDFLDPLERFSPEFIKAHLFLQWGLSPEYANCLPKEEVQEHIDAVFYDDDLDRAEYVLKMLIADKKRALQQKMHTLPLAAYVKLFDTFRSEKALREAGLWGREVDVKECEILSIYKEIIVDPSKGYIGWEYPVTASTFEMSVELPVVFEKIDGNSISLGVPLESLELRQ